MYVSTALNNTRIHTRHTITDMAYQRVLGLLLEKGKLKYHNNNNKFNYYYFTPWATNATTSTTGFYTAFFLFFFFVKVFSSILLKCWVLIQTNNKWNFGIDVE